MLLLSLSNTPADRKVVLTAITKCDLRDLQATDYFLNVQRMAALGEDTTAAAFRILSEPKFTAFIPQHVLTLAQNYSLVYMLLPTDPDYWLGPAIARLKTEAEPTAQKSLLLLLQYAQTDAADQAILSFSSDAAKNADSRAYARELLDKKASLAQKAQAVLSSETTLRAKRRERMKSVSDEALYDLDDYTMLLVAKRH